MKLMSGRGAQKTSADSKKLQMYSKQWLPGDTMRLFLPIFKNDIGSWDLAVGALWGHKVNDFEGIGLKTAFIPSLTQFDENGDPVGPPDITYKFSQIAKIFIDGQKAIEEARLQNKRWPTESARKEALQKLDYDYDTKNNMKAIKPAIGRATYMICTETLCLKYVNGAPVSDSAAVVSLPLSSKRIDELYAILDDPKYAPADDAEFMEVEWKYPANPDKGQSGNASHPSGLTPEYRLETEFPDAYKKVSGMFNLVSRDYESIVRRATRRIDEAKIRGAITQYSYTNSESLDACSEENEDTLVKNAQLIHELSIERALNNQELIDKIKAELDKIVTEVPEEVPNLGAPITDANNPTGGIDLSQMQTAGMPDLSQMQATTDLTQMQAAPATEQPAEAGAPAANIAAGLESVTGAPSIQGLLNNNNFSNMTEGEMESVNLDMM